MDFTLTEEQLAIREMARDFAQKEIAPTVDDDYKEHRYPKEIVKKMAELGFFGCVVPEEYGGTGAGHLAASIAAEEIARVSSSMRLPFNTQINGPGLSILEFGSEEQKRKYVPKLVSAQMLGCFAISEPNAGSDVASMETTAMLDGDHWVLNGTKTWISAAQAADLSLVYAYTDKEQKYRGISAFLVESSSPGYSTRPLDDKMGIHSSPTGEIILEDCRIPKDAILGQPGQGFKICMTELDYTRLGAASGALGVAQGCLDVAVKYAMEREQFGQKIGNFQMNQEIIARMAVEIDAARLLVYRAAWQKDQKMRNTLETSMAKYFASEAAVNCSNGAMRILSAYGYSGEYPAQRYYRDAMSYPIVEGTANVHKMIISLDALGIRKANR